MDIKRRLIISNTVMVVIPFLITAIIASTFIFVASRFFNRDMSYDNFMRLAEIRTELAGIGSSLTGEDFGGMEERKLKEYLTHRLSGLNGKYIITRGNSIIASSGDISKIDAERVIESSESQSLNRNINIDNVSYIIQSTNLASRDGASQRIILLAPTGTKGGLFKEFIIVVISVFVISFVATNFITSLQFSKRILTPIALLKNAAAEISSGNLNYEIAEEGDEEIRELCRDFEVMRIQLKDSINMKMKYDDNRKMLISSISHDLKTPITSIKGYVEGILDGVANTPEKRENYLRTIYTKAENVDAMIDDLLLYSKLDLNQLPFNFEKTDIVEYFSYCVNETENELAKFNIEINLINNIRGSSLVMLDRERMKRVVMNIIDNSRKYMGKEEGKISIGLRETNSSIIVEIRDNGRGISGGDINKIFDRFYRGDLARSGTKGSGLGLAIGRQIVEGHGGRIWAVSHGDEGTSILISLKKIMESRGL